MYIYVYYLKLSGKATKFRREESQLPAITFAVAKINNTFYQCVKRK